jgi:hypothetical protein
VIVLFLLNSLESFVDSESTGELLSFVLLEVCTISKIRKEEKKKKKKKKKRETRSQTSPINSVRIFFSFVEVYQRMQTENLPKRSYILLFDSLSWVDKKIYQHIRMYLTSEWQRLYPEKGNLKFDGKNLPGLRPKVRHL